MKMTIIGGGPGGLFAALLCKKAKPDWDIEIFERNKADDTFGFGVVFSDETLDEFLSRDKAVHNNIRNEFSLIHIGRCRRTPLVKSGGLRFH